MAWKTHYRHCRQNVQRVKILVIVSTVARFSNLGNMKYHRLTLSSSDDDDSQDGSRDGSLAYAELKPELKRPSMYKVIMLNDDYTPMEFVVEVLEQFFKMHREQATQIMLKVHTNGSAVCGVFTRDIAETKASQVNQYARENQHPLLCEIEAADDDE